MPRVNARRAARGCADSLRVLADPTRLAVVELLLRGPQHVGDMNGPLRIEPSLLSHHLRVLREAGLVTARRDGRAVVYRLAPGVEAAAGQRAIDLGCCRLTFE